jgi:hypothetical protein
MKSNLKYTFFVILCLLSFNLIADMSHLYMANSIVAFADTERRQTIKDFLLYGSLLIIIILLALLLLKKDTNNKTNEKAVVRNKQSLTTQKNKSENSNTKMLVILFYCFMALIFAIQMISLFNKYL